MSASPNERNERVKRINDAIEARRLMHGDVVDHETARCALCGELLHPYPEPTYWMQYPLPSCHLIDGLRLCDRLGNGNEKCLDAYLIAHPTKVGPTKPPRKVKAITVTKAKTAQETKDEAVAACAATLPQDEAGMLRAAKVALEAMHAAVMRGDWEGVRTAFLPYNAAIWKLNGGTFFGCMADEHAPGRRVQRFCAATPGEVPMWGQTGDFLLTVDGMRCWVEVGRGYGDDTNASLSFHAVDLDAAFISQTGYRSHFANAEAGKTVADVAESAIRYYLSSGKGRQYIASEEAEKWLVKKELPAWLAAVQPPPRREPADDFFLASETVPDGFELVDVVVKSHQAFQIRKWAEAAKPRIRAAVTAARSARQDPVLGPAPEQRAAVAVKPEGTLQVQDVAGTNAFPHIEAGKSYEVISENKWIIVAKVNPAEFATVWGYDDRPLKYRTNRAGRKVVASDPQCIQTLYSIADLRLAESKESS